MKGFFDASLLGGKAAISQIPACGACGLYKSCLSPKMPVTGKGGRKILIVGEAPGETEDERNKQFIGKAGQRLEREFRAVGIDMRKDCWLTNSIICWPGSGNPTPNPKQIEWCRPNLFNTLEELQPEIILCFGMTAVRSLLGRIWRKDVGKIGRWVGYQIPNQKPNAWICPMYHPSYLERMNDPVMDLHFHRHLKKAVSLEGRPWEKLPEYEKQVQVLINPEEAAHKLKRFIAKRPTLIAFDYETNMLKPDSQEASIYTCAVSDSETTLAYPWHGEAVQLTKQLLMDKTIGKVASNLKFEERWTQKEFGTGVKGWAWDTMQSAHILDNRKANITGLKFQAYIYLGAESYDDHISPFLEGKNSNKPNKIKQADLKQLLIYNGVDALLEVLLAPIQMRKTKYTKWR